MYSNNENHLLTPCFRLSSVTSFPPSWPTNWKTDRQYWKTDRQYRKNWRFMFWLDIVWMFFSWKEGNECIGPVWFCYLSSNGAFFVFFCKLSSLNKYKEKFLVLSVWYLRLYDWFWLLGKIPVQFAYFKTVKNRFF